MDVTNEKALDDLISGHDLVISLIPYTYHPLVIKSAIKFKKHVVTTSYVSPAMREFDAAAKENDLTIMNEIGLDPGIDHLYAVKTIDEVMQLEEKSYPSFPIVVVYRLQNAQTILLDINLVGLLVVFYWHYETMLNFTKMGRLSKFLELN